VNRPLDSRRREPLERSIVASIGSRCCRESSRRSPRSIRRTHRSPSGSSSWHARTRRFPCGCCAWPTARRAGYADVDTIPAALARVGTRTLAELILALSAIEVFVPRTRQQRDLWMHSLTALSASCITTCTIARTLDSLSGSSAYTVMGNNAPGPYSALPANPRVRGVLLDRPLGGLVDFARGSIRRPDGVPC